MPTEVRNEQVRVRLTVQEKETLARLAGDDGLKMGSFIRRLIAQAAKAEKAAA